jgi:hypothetical protein
VAGTMLSCTAVAIKHSMQQSRCAQLAVCSVRSHTWAQWQALVNSRQATAAGF